MLRHRNRLTLAAVAPVPKMLVSLVQVIAGDVSLSRNRRRKIAGMAGQQGMTCTANRQNAAVSVGVRITALPPKLTGVCRELTGLQNLIIHAAAMTVE